MLYDTMQDCFKTPTTRNFNIMEDMIISPLSDNYDFANDFRSYNASSLGAIFFGCNAEEMNLLLYRHGLIKIDLHAKKRQWYYTFTGRQFRHIPEEFRNNPRSSPISTTTLRWSARVVPYLRYQIKHWI